MANNPPFVITPLLVNAPTAAAMLSMSRSFFYENVSTGKIPKPIRFGRKSLWSVEVLTDFVHCETSKQGVK